MIKTMNEIVAQIFGPAVGEKSGSIYPATVEQVKMCMKAWAEAQAEIDLENASAGEPTDKLKYNFFIVEDEEKRPKCRICLSTDLSEIGMTAKGVKYLCEECDHVMYKDKEGVMND